MAIKSRLLSKLKFTYMTTTMAATAHPHKLRPVLHNLEEARELCQQGLTESNYAKYGEVYDGLIMAVRQILSGEAGKDAGEIVGLCKELLEHIMAETSKEEHFKKEMVFLPYKASMWDSLESVWRAAYEDKENCLAYVIPIPYCDRNPDGTAKEWHCERELFPKDVPTLDWQEVDLKGMHPDVIFIHNPYDNCNRVTSVDSCFYSDKLKKYTEKLVYVPYFVMSEIAPHLCQVPGVVNADYVIVDSEKNKKIYEENYSVGKPLEGKFLLFGSPKYDKIANIKMEDYTLPQAWEQLIAGRKVVLYNTSITAHLEHAMYILNKLYEVMNYFRGRKDIAFWWRPHPLLEATLNSMIPQVAAGYKKIKDEYLQLGWGIFDDTPDLNRALAWGDVYYGDWSSCALLFQTTGKPIMIQNFEVTNDKDEQFGRNLSKNAHFLDAEHHEGYMYYSEIMFNGMFRVKNGEDKAEFIGHFPYEDLWEKDLHRQVFAYEGKLYFIPCNGYKISVYNINDGTFLSIDIGDDARKKHCFVQGVINGNVVLLVPINSDTPFVKLYLSSGKIEVLSTLTKSVLNVMTSITKDYTVYKRAVWDGSYLYIMVGNTSEILKVNLKNKKIKLIHLPCKLHMCHFNKFGDDFWFVAQEHKLFYWNEQNKTCKTYDIPDDGKADNFPYLTVLNEGQDLLLLAGWEDRCWRFNSARNEWIDISKKMPTSFKREIDNMGLLVDGGKKVDGEYYFYPRAGNGVVKYLSATRNFSFLHVRISEEDLDKIHDEWLLSFIRDGVFYEGEFGLNDLIKDVVDENYLWQQNNTRKHSSIGRYIYNYIKAKC